MRISKDCSEYADSHSSAAWLAAHAGGEVEIIGDDGDSGMLKVYFVRSLSDGTEGRAWKRELEK